MRHLTAALVATTILATSSALAAPEERQFDRAHTLIAFTVDHLGFSTTYGAFTEFDGTLSLDQDDPSNSSVSVMIDSASVDSRDADRDGHVRSADFLDVENNPTITFESTSVNVTGDNTAEVTGDLTILDISNPVTLDVTLNQIGPNPFFQTMTAGFSATATLNRSDWGIEFGVPAIGDEITVIIETELIQPE
ncbi:MAG: YceI family protein [Pseudomonadota bacterium]